MAQKAKALPTTKCCSRCGRERPNTDKFFQPLNGRGLSAECRDCLRARFRKFHETRKAIKQAGPEARRQLRAEMKAAAARRRSHINDDGTKQCIGCKNSFPATGKSFYMYKSGYMDGRCKSCRRDYQNAGYHERNAKMATDLQSQVPREDPKICNRCGSQKPLGEFPKTGRICKECKKAYHTQWRAKAFARVCWKCGESKPSAEMQQGQRRTICKSCFQARTKKRCRKCGKYKPLTCEFWPPAADAADGFRGECTECRAKRDAAKYEAQKSDPLYRERKAKNAGRWYRNNLEYARRRNKRHNAKPEVKQRRQERYTERRATDPEFVEQNKGRSRDWYQANKDRVSEESRARRAARRLANGDGRKRRTNRSMLKYATEIWQPRSPSSDDIAGDLPGGN